MNRPNLQVSARPEVVGHGGAGDFFPGNSQQSIEKALEIGIDRIEVDVRCSADGDLVLVHDERVSVDNERPALVSELSTSALRSALPGFLTLTEAVEVVGGRAPFMLDIKSGNFGAELISAIAAHGLAGDSSISCEQLALLRRLRAAFPTMRTGISSGHISSGAPTILGKKIVAALVRPVLIFPLIGALFLSGATEIMVFHRTCSRTLVAGLHRQGYFVNVWTVDRPASMRRALQLGADGIISNRPDLLREELAKFRSTTSS